MMNLDQIIYRFKQIKEIKTDKEVAAELNLSPTDFSNRKKRETLLPLIIEALIHENVNMNWLLMGEGEMLAGENENTVHKAKVIRTPHASREGGDSLIEVLEWLDNYPGKATLPPPIKADILRLEQQRDRDDAILPEPAKKNGTTELP